ncbi:TonB-dependent receptor plug domain-containing protein [Paraflavitalea speifideaquila]|uniref:TonB-dependent receptor plug domain-containing protein n=1 Tax=Paraflavitalea speifideaquila TaxID=3076558 RepID=UPI0028EC8169|nr:TonB-dependent receptor plug domain-containing protein [Paraflavitalea speifideiaquila]
MLLAGQSALAQQATQPVSDTLKIGKDSSYWSQPLRLPWNYTLPRKYYAGAVSSITGEEMARFRVANNSNMLAGRLAGLKTSMGSEEPGYDGSALYIRGDNTYNNGAMYVYVDNIPVGFNQLDPLEIDQLVVLKDAAAAGTYGIRGANKGIAVTTRRGEIGKSKINFYSQVGFLSPMDAPDYLGAKDYMTLYNEAAINDGLPARYPDAQIAAYNDPARNKEVYPDVNWYDELIKKQALQQKYNLTFSGGTKDVRYFVLLGYMNQQGFYKYSDINEKTMGYSTNANFKRYNFRSNLDFNINPSLLVALDLAGRLETKNFPGSPQSSIWGNIALYPPNLFPMLYANGKIGGNQQYNRNPYGLLTQTGYTREVHRNLSSTARIEQKLDKLVKGLSVTGAFAYYNYYYNNEGATMNFATWELQPGGDYKQFGTDVSYNFRSRTQSQERMNTVWAKADYKTNFGFNHDFAAQAGFYQSVTTPAGDDFPYATQGFWQGLLCV